MLAFRSKFGKHIPDEKLLAAVLLRSFRRQTGDWCTQSRTIGYGCKCFRRRAPGEKQAGTCTTIRPLPRFQTYCYNEEKNRVI